MQMTNKENYTRHVGMRLTPSMFEKLVKVAKRNNMPPAVFARWILLNQLDALSVN